LQLAQLAAAGTEKALLAEVTAKYPDASYVELLRLFKVRRSVADGQSLRACCIFACCALTASIYSQLPNLTITSFLPSFLPTFLPYLRRTRL
jgi:hypothetical protein